MQLYLATHYHENFISVMFQFEYYRHDLEYMGKKLLSDSWRNP